MGGTLIPNSSAIATLNSVAARESNPDSISGVSMAIFSIPISGSSIPNMASLTERVFATFVSAISFSCREFLQNVLLFPVDICVCSCIPCIERMTVKSESAFFPSFKNKRQSIGQTIMDCHGALRRARRQSIPNVGLSGKAPFNFVPEAEAAMPTSDHAPQRIAIAGAPAWRASATPTSSVVFAAAYVPCPREPIMAKEEKITAERRLNAPGRV